MQIFEILRNKGDFVATVPPDTPVRDLLARLAEHNVGAMVVSTDGIAPVGMVSERDVVRRLTGGAEILDGPVSAIMTSLVHSCTPTDSVRSLMRTMTDARVRHIPVLVDGRLAGIVSIGDVVKAHVDDLEFERDQLHQYIAGGIG